MNLILGGLCESLLVTGGFGGSGVFSTLTFRQTLLAKLESISELTAVVGDSIYPGALPETHDLARDGPALTYAVPSLPRNHQLTGSDGTATAKVQFNAWSYNLKSADAATLAILNDLDGDGSPSDPWAAGGVAIKSCLHQNEYDQHQQPKAGSDQWTYRIISEYRVEYWLVSPLLA